MAKKISLELIVLGCAIGMASGLVGCSGGSEEQGRARVKPAQVVGVYRLKLDQGSERLELRTDGTYVQDTPAKAQFFHHTGQWHLESRLLDGSEIILLNAVVASPATPLDRDPRPGFGDIAMHVHNRSGKVALARNEVAEWYYDRVE
jgi:hypothetical protein